MPTLKIRNVPEWAVMAHRARAAHLGRSLEQQLRVVVTEEAERYRREMAAKADTCRDELRARSGTLPDSAPQIRADRHNRG